MIFCSGHQNSHLGHRYQLQIILDIGEKFSSPDLKSLLPFKRKVNYAVGDFPVLNVISFQISAPPSLRLLPSPSPKLLSLPSPRQFSFITTTSKPADNGDRYLVFITTPAHGHLVIVDFKARSKKYLSPASPGPHRGSQRKGRGSAHQGCCLKGW